MRLGEKGENFLQAKISGYMVLCTIIYVLVVNMISPMLLWLTKISAVVSVEHISSVQGGGATTEHVRIIVPTLNFIYLFLYAWIIM